MIKHILFVILGTIAIYSMYIMDTRNNVEKQHIVESDKNGELSSQKVDCDVIKTKDNKYFVIFPNGELWELHPRNMNPLSTIEVDE